MLEVCAPFIGEPEVDAVSEGGPKAEDADKSTQIAVETPQFRHRPAVACLKVEW